MRLIEVFFPGIHSVWSRLTHRFWKWLPPLGVGLTYLCFPTRSYYWDGISFAATIENASHLSSSLIHHHHLLYNVFGYLLYGLTQIAGLHFRALEVLQVANGVMATLCAWLLLRVLHCVLGSLFISSLLALAFSFSAPWWKYATDADSYIPSVMFLLLALNLLLTADRISPVLIAFAHAAAMCFHQLAIFFYPVVVVGILLQGSSERWRNTSEDLICY